MTLREVWGRAFGIAGMITPSLFGACAAAVASGAIRVHNGASPVALLHPLVDAVRARDRGDGARSLCDHRPDLPDGRSAAGAEQAVGGHVPTRAFIAGAFLAVLGIAGLALSPSEAPLLWQGMLDHALWAVVVTMLIGLAIAAALYFRRFRLARVLIVLGQELSLARGDWHSCPTSSRPI